MWLGACVLAIAAYVLPLSPVARPGADALVLILLCVIFAPCFSLYGLTDGLLPLFMQPHWVASPVLT